MIVLGLICSMLIGMPLMELVGALISGISTPLANWLLSVGVASVIVSLLCNAVLTAVTFALQMACYVFGISLVFGFMEDIGYMARISYVFDNTMTKLGLQGKAIMPFLVSFGCNIGGVTGTRVIDSWGQRILTIALSWVVPCASTWGCSWSYQRYILWRKSRICNIVLVCCGLFAHLHYLQNFWTFFKQGK